MIIDTERLEKLATKYYEFTGRSVFIEVKAVKYNHIGKPSTSIRLSTVDLKLPEQFPGTHFHTIDEVEDYINSEIGYRDTKSIFFRRFK